VLLTAAADYSGLLRGERGFLRQVRVQESWIGDGTLLRRTETEPCVRLQVNGSLGVRFGPIISANRVCRDGFKEELQKWDRGG